MKKLLLIALILLPPPIFAMQEQANTEIEDKEYYENVMGSLVLVAETPTKNGSQINGKFRQGVTIVCTKNKEEKTEVKFIMKNGQEIEPEAFLETPDNIYSALSKRASMQAIAEAKNKNN